MEAIGAVNTGREAKQAARPASLVARLTAPLMAALADRYQDSYVRDGGSAATGSDVGGKGILQAGIDLVSNVVDGVVSGAEAAWDKTKAAAGWVANQARALSNWVASKVAKAFTIFSRTSAETERRQQEEVSYQKKYAERKAEEKRLAARSQQKRAEQIRLVAKRSEDIAQIANHKASADAGAVAALATDRVSAPVPGAEKHQLVDNATLERRRVRKMLTGMLPA